MTSVADPTPNAATTPTSPEDPATGITGANADAGYKCVSCHKPIQKRGRFRKRDRFCNRCGYSTKKCGACGKKLPSAGEFCPRCGTPRGGRQVVRTSATRGGLIGSFLKYLAAPAIAALIVALFFAQPAVPRSSAQDFFRAYFTGVTSGKQRAQLYAQDLSTSFKQFAPNAPGAYNGYWKTVRSVTVSSVFPVPGNPYEFTVSLMIIKKAGGIYPIRVNYWLVCTSFGILWGRVIGCPAGDLKIDNEQSAPITQVSR
jgi:hypothetical protein